jgi:FAD/FMN-containing dehydrogenase
VIPKAFAVDPSIHNRLKDILPSGGLLTDPDDLKRYHRADSGRSSPPFAILFPRTSAQVQEIVQLAHEERLPLTLRGGGTGLGKGAAAPRGGMVLSLSRMDRILEVSPENSLAVVQPGISARRLDRHLEDSGWFYPVDPASWRWSTLGGDVATRAHGLREARYGPIGSYLLGLEAVISPGEVIRCGAKTLKCATGYHLVDLFAGSFGRLGVITQIILKLIPRPPLRATVRAVLEDLDVAAETASRLRTAGIQPARWELIGPQAARTNFTELINEGPRDGYLILMELEASEPEDLDEQTGRAVSCLLEPAVSLSEEVPDLWRRRQELLRRLTDKRPASLLATARIPPSRLSNFWKQTQKVLGDHSCSGTFFGHLGEGRWHMLIHRTKEPLASNESLTAVSRTLQEIASACGGLYLPPRALGWTPQEPLTARRDSSQKRIWKALKNRFDPLELFGPAE